MVLKPPGAVVVGDVVLRLDARPGCALDHTADAELLLRVLPVADGHDETPLAFFRLALHEQVEAEVVVGAVVRDVAPDPCAALDRLDPALPADARRGFL
jgi:hypothetical protein